MKGDRDEKGVFTQLPIAGILFPGFKKKTSEIPGDEKTPAVFQAVDEVKGHCQAF